MMDLNKKNQILINELILLNKSHDDFIKLDYTFYSGCFFEENTQTIFININDLEEMSVNELKWVIHHEFRHSQQSFYKLAMFIPLMISPLVFLLVNYFFNLDNLAVIPTLIITSHLINFIRRSAEIDADSFANINLGKLMVPFFKKMKKEKEISISMILYWALFGSSHPSYNRRIKG